MPKRQPDRDADPATRLGVSIGERLPLRRAARPVGRVDVGEVGRHILRFAGSVGLSLSSRRAAGEAVPEWLGAGLPLGPPEDLWPEWIDREPERSVRTGDAEFDRLHRTMQAMRARKARPARVVRRGLPRATTRARNSRMGAATGPAGGAARFRAEPAPVHRHPAVVPTGAGGTSPGGAVRTTRGAALGGSSNPGSAPGRAVPTTGDDRGGAGFSPGNPRASIDPADLAGPTSGGGGGGSRPGSGLGASVGRGAPVGPGVPGAVDRRSAPAPDGPGWGGGTGSGPVAHPTSWAAPRFTALRRFADVRAGASDGGRGAIGLLIGGSTPPGAASSGSGQPAGGRPDTVAPRPPALVLDPGERSTTATTAGPTEPGPTRAGREWLQPLADREPAGREDAPGADHEPTTRRRSVVSPGRVDASRPPAPGRGATRPPSAPRRIGPAAEAEMHRLARRAGRGPIVVGGLVGSTSLISRSGLPRFRPHLPGDHPSDGDAPATKGPGSRLGTQPAGVAAPHLPATTAGNVGLVASQSPTHRPDRLAPPAARHSPSAASAGPAPVSDPPAGASGADPRQFPEGGASATAEFGSVRARLQSNVLAGWLPVPATVAVEQRGGSVAPARQDAAPPAVGGHPAGSEAAGSDPVGPPAREALLSRPRGRAARPWTLARAVPRRSRPHRPLASREGHPAAQIGADTPNRVAAARGPRLPGPPAPAASARGDSTPTAAGGSVSSPGAPETGRPADRGGLQPEIVDQFTRELARHPAPVVRPLPPHLEPLARAVGGSPRARISTSTASRRALERVDRVAATTGDVIHVVRTPGHDPASTEVMAHELAHTATPVAEPRFFDDPRPSADEHRATMAGEIAKRVAREFETDRGGGPRGTAALPVGGMSGLFGSIDERPASGSRLQRSPARSSDSAASVHRGSAPAGAAADRAGGGHPAPLAPLVSDLPEAVGRLAQPPSTVPPGSSPGGAPADTERPDDDHPAPSIDLDAVVEALERRVIEELERRGRFRPEVF